jgi:hypothetical protein
MNRGRGSQAGGYTIVETLIFLAVSGAMFVAAMLFLGGQQAKAEFSQSVHDFESTMQSIANNVSNGYYANVTGTGGKLGCTISGGAIDFTSETGVDAQGSHEGCIYAGQAVLFGPADHGMSARTGYTLLTIGGKRLDASGQPVEDIADAGLAAAAPTPAHNAWPDATTSNVFQYGVTVGCVFYTKSTTSINTAKKPCVAAPSGSLPTTPGTKLIDTVSFITTFEGSDVQDSAHSGSIQVDLLVPVPPADTLPGRTTRAAATDIDAYSAVPLSWLKNPAGGVYVCLDSGGTKQFGLIRLGGNASRFSTSTVIASGSCK